MAENIFQQPNLSVFGQPTTPVDYSGLAGGAQGTVFSPLMNYLTAGATVASQEEAAANLARQKQVEAEIAQKREADKLALEAMKAGKGPSPTETEKLFDAIQKANDEGNTKKAAVLQRKLDKMLATQPSLATQVAAGVAGGMSPVTQKPTMTAIEKQQLGAANLQASIGDVRSAADAVPDDAWTVQGRVIGQIDDVLARFGKPRTKEDVQKRRAFTRMVSSAGRMFDDYRKQVTGAAAAVRELEILKTRLPNADGYLNFDSKVDFYSKLDNLEKFNKAAMERLAKIKSLGFEIVPSDTGNLLARNKDTNEIIDVAVEFPLDFSQFDTAEAQHSTGTPKLVRGADGVWRMQ